MKKIIIIIVVAFIVIISVYEIKAHYNNPVMVARKLPNFPVHSDFSLQSTNTKIVRMHIIDVNQPNDVLISRARRAVVERKVGVIYLKGNYSKRLVLNIEETLKKVGFKIGTPRPFAIPKYINIISASLLILLFSIFFFIDVPYALSCFSTFLSKCYENLLILKAILKYTSATKLNISKLK
jgi:hypothetical protein